MNPYPFELLNHFTVPCTSCLLWQVTLSTLGADQKTIAAMSTNCVECIKMVFLVNISLQKKLPLVCFYAKNRFNSTLRSQLYLRKVR